MHGRSRGGAHNVRCGRVAIAPTEWLGDRNSAHRQRATGTVVLAQRFESPAKRRPLQLVVDESEAEANSRITGIRLALLTTRCMELWRREKHDPETVLILLSVVAITSEKFTRSGLTDAQRALATYLPLEELQGCNVASIAAATGLNRETTRRRVEALVRDGALIRTPAGELAVPPSRVQDPAMLDLLRKQLDAVTRFVNGLIRDGSLTEGEPRG